LVFDAAHGFGAKFHGRPVGPFGDAEVFSLSPTKLVVAGEGGVVATNDRKLAQHVRYGREYGNPGDYGSLFPGLNARMSELHALLGKHSLANLEENATSRNRVVAIIRDRLERLPGIRFQQVHSGNRCSYKDLSMVVEERAFGLTRDELAQALRPEGVDTRKYHDPPVHRHRAYEDLQMKVRESLPVTAHIAPRSISLPIWSHMPEEIADRICMAVERIHGHASEIRRELRA
jgi:dTDP-4-amino-4,6-dideoxygalactose transaminase